MLILVHIYPVRLTILDNDLPPVASIVTTATVPEASGANDATGLVVTLGVASGKTVKVGYAFADVSAEQGVDYTATDDTLTFTPSTTTGLTPTSIFVPFSIIQDTVNEADETFTITLSEPSEANATVDDENKLVTVTIKDDDTTLPIVGIANAEGDEGNGINNGKVIFTISLTSSDGTPVAAGRDIDVNVSTSSPSTGRAIATAGTDYQIVTNQKVTIAKGTTSNTIDINTIQDPHFESDEIFEVILSDPVYADISNTANKAVGTILSDDKPVFEIVDVRQAEGNSSVNNNMKFKVRLSSGASGQASVHYATSDGPALTGGAEAIAGSDYTETTSAGGTPLHFAAGETEKTILVPIIGDEAAEHNDTFTLTLSSPSSGVEILNGGGSATGTILNDDGLAVSEISVAPASGKARIREGQAVEFTFTADPVLLDPMDVKISLSDPQNFLAPGVVNTKMIRLGAGGTHTESFLTKTANTKFDPDNIVTLTIEADATKYNVGTPSTAEVVVEDTLTPSGISVIALENSVTESDSMNPTADFQVKSNIVHSSERVVNIAISQGDANFLSTDSLAIENVTIGAGKRSKMLPIPIESDGVFEIHGEVRVEILTSDSSSASYSVARTNNTASIAVLDDDFPRADANGSVSIRAIKSSVSETEMAPFQIVAKRTMSQVRTVKVLVENKNTGDFLPATTYDNAIDVIIGVGALYANFDVLLDDDSKYEAEGAITATIQAENLSGGATRTYTVSSVNRAEIAVTSDDPDVPIIEISSAAETSGVTEGFSFDFVLTSDRQITGNPLEIQLTPSYNGGSVDPNIRITGRTVSIPVGATKATGTVTMNSGFDIGSSDNVEVKIAVDEAVVYDVKATESSITVPIKDNDAPSRTTPRMSITSVNYVADGEMATFSVTASHQPASTIDVKVFLSGKSFLDTTQATGVTVPFDGTKTTETFKVATKSGSVTTNHGIITATILEGTGYVRSNTIAKNETSVAVVDNLPVISISEIANVNKSAGTFSFTLTSDYQAIAGYPINITKLSVDDTNTTGPQYYTSHSPTQAEITNLSTRNSEDVIVTITADNTTYQGWGEITATLTNGADYVVDTSASTRAITIVDDQDAPVSIAVSARGSVIEGNTVDVTFTATGTFPTGESIELIPTVTDTGAITGHYSSHTPQQITLSAGNTSDKITITTVENTLSQIHGEVTIRIVRGDGYEVDGTNHTKVIAVLDEEILPTVSVDAVGTAIDEGQDAVFELSATGTLTKALEVDVSVDDGAGDFLTTTYNRKTETIPTTGSVRVPYSTTADIVDEANGTITVEVLADDSDIIAYLVADLGGSDTLIVNDNDDTSLPSITIAADQSPINEGDVASFTLTSDRTFTAPLTVLVEIIETNSGTGDFLAGASNSYTPDRINIDATTRKGKIPLPTVPDATSEDNGTITVRIKTDNLPTKTYSVGTSHQASIDVNDDDNASLPRVNIELTNSTQTTITEAAGNASFTIKSSNGTGSLAVDVNITQDGNFLTNGEEVVTRSINIGSDFVLPIAIQNDEFDEANGVVYATLKLRNPQTYSIGENRQAQVAVDDNDESPVISISTATTSVAEGTDTNSANYNTYTFDVTLDRQSIQDITVEFAIGAVGDTAKEGASEDYTHSYDTAAKRTLTFNGASNGEVGETAKTITVTIVADALNEVNEQFTVTLSKPSNAVFAENKTSISAVGTIIDDDGPPSISFESATAQANEGSNVNFSVLLSASSGRDITIAYTLADGSAKVGNNDYTNPAEADRTITIPANSRRGTISVATIQDRTAEIDEDFTITLNEPANTTIVTLGTRTKATGTIISDDAAIVNIVNTNTNGAVTEGGDATFEVTLYGRFPGNFSAIWTVLNGTAVRPNDYTEAIGLGTINFRSNERSGTISISTVDDNIDEADQEDFSVSISLTNRNVFTLNDMATVYINDNDSAPEISFGTMSPITEPDTSTTTVRIPVTLSHPAYRRVTVDFAVADGTATLTQDYTVLTTSPTLIFRRGDVEEFIEISIIGDTNHEADETFKITLSNATRSTIATAASTGVSFAINNDDDAPVFTISKTAIIAEGATAPDNTAKFTVTQTPGSGKAVSIPYTFTDVSAVEGTDYTATAGKTGTLSFPASNSPAASVTREIEFSVLADNLDEFDETFTVTLSNPTVPADGTIDTNNNNHIGTGTITDDDDLPALTIADSSQEEGRSVGFTPTLSVVSGRDVVVTYSTHFRR